MTDREVINAVCHKFNGTRIYDAQDIRQCAELGLLLAKKNFDEQRNEASFSTYAYKYVWGFVQHEIRDKDSVIRIPSFFFTKVKMFYKKGLDEENDQDIQKFIKEEGIKNKERFIDVLKASSTKNAYNEATGGLKCGQTRTQSPEDIVIKKEEDDKMLDNLYLAMSKLSKKQREALTLFYEFDRDEADRKKGRTKEDVANILGITRQSASERIDRAHASLRKFFSALPT